MTVTLNIALILLRLVVGLTLVGHGTQKLFGWFAGPGLARLTVLSDGRAEIIAGFRRLRRRTMSGFQPSSLTSRINRTIVTK